MNPLIYFIVSCVSTASVAQTLKFAPIFPLFCSRCSRIRKESFMNFENSVCFPFIVHIVYIGKIVENLLLVYKSFRNTFVSWWLERSLDDNPKDQ